MISYLITKFKYYISAFVVFIGILSTVFLKGILKGRAQVTEKIRAENAKAKELRGQIDANVKNANDSDLDSRASRWVSDK